MRSDGRNLSALRIPLRGLFFRRHLIHGTSMGRRTAKKLSSRTELLASNISTAHASKIELLHAWP